MFDFKKAIAEAKDSLKASNLFAIILGPSGGGKSTLAGTTKEKTLFIAFRGEKHGAVNSAARGGDIHPVILDVEDGKDLTPDETYQRLLDVLNSPSVSEFKTIVLDGWPELETILLRSKAFMNGCMDSKGKHNNFAESRVMITLLKPVLEGLNKWHTKGHHIITTCKLDVKALDGTTATIEEAVPRLMTYSVAEDIISKFADILVVGRATNGKIWKHKLQFNAEVTRTSKDANQQIKKFINFSPRVSGVQTLPELLDADLSLVIDLKKGKGGNKDEDNS